MHGNGCKLVHVLMELMDVLPCGKCDLKLSCNIVLVMCFCFYVELVILEC
jgi:hypothetical protein